MIVKNLRYSAIALAAIAFCSCQKEALDIGSPQGLSGLHRPRHRDGLRRLSTPITCPTASSSSATATGPNTGRTPTTLQIVGTVADRMEEAGYTRTDDKETADVGLQLSYVEKVTYFVGYNDPYWWWYYPYYWTPGYWGDWLGWHYPYRVYYGYTAGSLLIEMLDLEADQQSGKKLPVIWDSYIGGLLTSSESLNLQRTVDAVEQAFDQSPYLKK